jgi:DNA-binding NtrC family response regulator/tetratricopeptide (TPR) repeat protein
LYTKFLRVPPNGDAISSVFWRCATRAANLHFVAAHVDSATRELLADRFVSVEGRWIDLASGSAVQMVWRQSDGRQRDLEWSDWCAAFARLRHPLINALLDYGEYRRDRMFEAYAAAGDLRLPRRPASLWLTHAVRFIESHGLTLTRESAGAALRGVVIADTYARSRAPAGRPIGVVLQTSGALRRVVEALDEAIPGGTRPIVVAGAKGSGLRTLGQLVAREARLLGYVVVSAAALRRFNWLPSLLTDRHVCVVIDETAASKELRNAATLGKERRNAATLGSDLRDAATLSKERRDAATLSNARHAAAAFLARLGTASARRHILLRFCRAAGPLRGAVLLQPMDTKTMSAMIYSDRDCGPSSEEVLNATRQAGGHPGRLLEALGGTCVASGLVRTSVVHESSPQYAFEAPAAVARVRRGVGRALLDAPERAARLAARGRHTAAARLLARASRVLEARREPDLAAACAEQLAWIDRDRGRSERAVEHFERARDLAGGSARAVRAAIGIGTVWTDQQRFIEAEAALRGAMASAELLAEAALERQAAVGLARCFLAQRRYEEARIALHSLTEGLCTDPTTTEACATLACVFAADGDFRSAIAAANDAVGAAERTGDARANAVAARAMASVQHAIGDLGCARHWIERALRAAAEAHLPIKRLRLRAQLITLLRAGDSSSTPHLERMMVRLRCALTRNVLPACARMEIEAAIGPASPRGVTISGAIEGRVLADLAQFLAVSQSAQDDGEAVERLCGTLCDRLRASSVQVIGGGTERRALGRAGRLFRPDDTVVDRVLTGGVITALDRSRDPHDAAEAIAYGREPIAVLYCRWTAGTAIDDARAEALMKAGALAAAAPVRSLLDRPVAMTPAAVCAELIGSCPTTVALRESVARAARAPFPVLIEGESGSGKELVARGIHRLSARRDRRVCTVNCAALSDDLLEAELFGHVRGAFTGAIGERPGLFEEADGGTLFLDEVGELSPRAQAKLLRVLQDGEVRRVGENLPRRVDVRIVAATNRRLADEVAAGRFRADLRFRLDVVRIIVPPLRDRASDIPALAAHFWTEAASRVGSASTMSGEALAALSRYDWPGNVRELQNVIASIAVHAPRRGRIMPSMLPVHVARSAPTSAASFEAARHDFERRFVRAALAQAGGKRTRAARLLGVSRQGLAKMLKRLDIEAEPE